MTPSPGRRWHSHTNLGFLVLTIQFSLSIVKVRILSNLAHLHPTLPRVLGPTASVLAENLTYTSSVIFPPACVHPPVLLGRWVKNAVWAITVPLPKLPVPAVNSSCAFPNLGAFACSTNNRNDRETIMVRRRVHRAALAAPSQAGQHSLHKARLMSGIQFSSPSWNHR